MKHLMLGGLALAACCGAATAADMPAAYKAAPRPFSWTGFYAGVNAGGAWGTSDLTTSVAGGFGAANQALVSSLDTLGFSPNGFTGGAQVGYNNQIANWVFGIEADFGYFGLKDSKQLTSVFVGGGDVTVNNSVETEWLLTVRPRLGYAADRSLLYVTGGLAATNIKYSSSLVSVAIAGVNQASAVSDTKAGWTIGGGWEYAFQNNWSMKAEYLYVDFDSVSMSSTGANGAGYTQSATLKANIARLGLNYRF